MGNVVRIIRSFLSKVLTNLRRFALPDLTPNVGLWWYFFTEMFDHFRSFFLMVFSVRHPTSLELHPPVLTDL